MSGPIGSVAISGRPMRLTVVSTSGYWRSSVSMTFACRTASVSDTLFSRTWLIASAPSSSSGRNSAPSVVKQDAADDEGRSPP